MTLQILDVMICSLKTTPDGMPYPVQGSCRLAVLSGLEPHSSYASLC
jgi:hypothetical protein